MYYSNYLNRFRTSNQITIGTEFRKNEPLTNDEIMRVAPSIFAVEKHKSRSDRYTYIPTYLILEGLRKEGFLPYAVSQSRSRIEGKQEFTKHMIKFRQAGQVINNVGDLINELLLVNSHDGTSSYILKAGIFRLACTNGLVVAKETIDNFKVNHKGNIEVEVIENAFKVAKNFEKSRIEIDKSKAIDLEPVEKEIFANAALMLKYGKEEKPIQANQLLEVRRYEDKKNDLFTTYNVIQENLLKGGLRAKTKSGSRTKTREVKGIDQNIKLNEALWYIMTQFDNIRNNTYKAM